MAASRSGKKGGKGGRGSAGGKGKKGTGTGTRGGDDTAEDKATAAALLDMVLGADLVAALQTAFLTNDCRGVVGALGASSNRHMAAAAAAAFAAACASGRQDVAGMFLRHGAVDGDARAARGVGPGAGKTALQHAAERGDAAMVRFLLASGAVSATCVSDSNDTALALAAEGGHESCLEALLEAEGVQAQVNHFVAKNDGALLRATKNGHPGCVRRLLSVDGIAAGGQDGCHVTPLFLALEMGHTECFQLLLAAKSNGINIQSHGYKKQTPLMLAASHGDAEPVRALLAVDGIDANMRTAVGLTGDTALTLASAAGHTESVLALLDVDGINTASRGGPDSRTALAHASANGHTKCLRALLLAGDVDVNACCRKDQSALYAAAAHGHTKCVRALLAVKGIDVNKTAAGISALQAAVEKGHDECLRVLVTAAGIDVNARKNLDGRSALQHALVSLTRRGAASDSKQQRRTARVRVLALAKGSNLNLRYPHYEFAQGSVLHAALACNAPRDKPRDVGTVSLLLVAGACRFQLDDEGRSPSDLAHRVGTPKPSSTTAAKAWLQTSEDLRKLFTSGIDYWQRRHHGGHGWAMKEVVRTLLLIRQRVAHLPAPRRSKRGERGTRRARKSTVPTLPEEIWLAV